MIFRLATTKDASALLSIYAQYIQTPITFECTLPSEQDFLERIQSISSFYPYVVAEEDGCVVGYAYAHRHMQREAYQWNAELSVYIDPNKASKVIGTRLVQKVLTLLKLQGIKKFAVVSRSRMSEAMDCIANWDLLWSEPMSMRDLKRGSGTTSAGIKKTLRIMSYHRSLPLHCPKFQLMLFKEFFLNKQ